MIKREYTLAILHRWASYYAPLQPFPSSVEILPTLVPRCMSPHLEFSDNAGFGTRRLIPPRSEAVMRLTSYNALPYLRGVIILPVSHPEDPGTRPFHCYSGFRRRAFYKTALRHWGGCFYENPLLLLRF